MGLKTHLTAAIVTILAVIIFLVLKPMMGFQFGLRTYWPLFLALYALIIYFASISNKSPDKIDS